MAKRDIETVEVGEQSLEGTPRGIESVEGTEVDAQALAQAFAAVGTGSSESETAGTTQPENEANESSVLLVSARRSNYIPVSELTPEQREERKRRSKEYRDRRKARAIGGTVKNNPLKAAEETALALIVITNQLVSFYFGRECEMSEIERDMIEEPLVRMLAKTDPAKMMKVNDYTDPLMLMVGIASWGYRINNVQSQKPKPPQPQGEVKQGVKETVRNKENGKPDYTLSINPQEAMHAS